MAARSTFTNLLAAIATGGVSAVLFSGLTDWFAGWIDWILDPTAWFNTGLHFFGWLLTQIGTFIGAASGSSDISTAVANAGTFLQAAPLKNGVNGILWVVSPFVTPRLLLACVAAIIYIRMVMLIVKLTLYLKGHVWSTSS